MSNLLSTSAMTAECQTRVPIGLSTTFWMKKLNEAYRWICQKGHFVWEMRRQEMALGIGGTSFQLPATLDPGKPMYLGGPYNFGLDPESSILSILPLVPAEDALDLAAIGLQPLPVIFLQLFLQLLKGAVTPCGRFKHPIH